LADEFELQAWKAQTDFERLAAGAARQLARHPLGVGAALAHREQNMRAVAAGGESQDLVDLEVFR